MKGERTLLLSNHNTANSKIQVLKRAQLGAHRNSLKPLSDPLAVPNGGAVALLNRNYEIA